MRHREPDVRLVALVTPAVEALHGVLRERLVAVHLVGDAVLGDDVAGTVARAGADLLAVVDGAPSPDELADVDAGHHRVTCAPLADLRSPMSVGRRWFGLADGAVTASADANDVRTRWVLRERGVVVLGPPARDLVAEATPEALRAEALGLARARAEAYEDDGVAVSAAWVRRSADLLWTAAHATVTAPDVATTWAADQVEPRLRPLLESARADRVDPDDPAVRALARALAWDVVRLTGTWALERRA